MKTILSLLVLTLTVCGTSTAQADASKSLNSDLIFSIKVNDNWKSNKQNLLTLTLRNNRQGRVIVKEYVGEIERNYTVELKNLKGEIVPLTANGQRLVKRVKNELAVIYARLATSDEITRTLDLAKLYSLKEGEKYTITVTKSVYIEAENKYRHIVKYNQNNIAWYCLHSPKNDPF